MTAAMVQLGTAVIRPSLESFGNTDLNIPVAAKDAEMRSLLLGFFAFALSACATMHAGSPTVSILTDLDPASTDRTVIVESITADRSGLLYLPDRVTGNILRVDPKSPKAVVVGRIEAREIQGKRVNADAPGVAFGSRAIFS